MHKLTDNRMKWGWAALVAGTLIGGFSLRPSIEDHKPLVNHKKVRLSGARLTTAAIAGIDLADADLVGADLTGVVLTGRSLRGADLRRAKLRGVSMGGGCFPLGDLSYADLRGADLTGAYLEGPGQIRGSWWRVPLRNARYDRHTRWPKGFDPVKSGALKVP
jgi:hypothetical protein